MMMKLAFMLVALAINTITYAVPQSVDVFEQNRRLGRGVDIETSYDYWKWKMNGDATCFRMLKDAGFNSVRIHLYAFGWDGHGHLAMDSTDGWKLNASWFATLDWAVQNAQKRGLQVILDLHESNGANPQSRMESDPIGNKEKFLAFWRQLSAHYQNARASVYFEILNEPGGKMTPELWNEYLAEALVIIREKNPTRTVIVSPTLWWVQPSGFQQLKLPENDHNIIVTFHYYYMPLSPGQTWGSEKDLTVLDRRFDRVAAWAKEHNRPIFLGEFGQGAGVPPDSRLRWIAAVARAAEERGWSWAYFPFIEDSRQDYRLFDLWSQPILHALIPLDDSPYAPGK